MRRKDMGKTHAVGQAAGMHDRNHLGASSPHNFVPARNTQGCAHAVLSFLFSATVQLHNIPELVFLAPPTQ